MADPAKKRATYEDVVNAPPQFTAEIVSDVLELSPRPTLAHAAALSGLSDELGPPFRRGRGGPGGWIILNEPELHLGRDVLVPDFAGWRQERMPALQAKVVGETIAPNWVCEVLSPSTAMLDRTKKLPIYAREQVDHVWLVDPFAHTLEVFRRTGSQWLLAATFADNDKVRAEPFEAIELDLSILWAGVI